MWKLLRFGFKAGLMSSAVYFTVHKGVWKDSETTGELYQDIQETVKPYVKPLVKQIPFEVPTLPKSGDIISSTITMWNKSVMRSFLFLVQIPDIAWEYTKKGSIYAYRKISEEIDALNNVREDESNVGQI